jgi:hypothetical protein
MKKIIIVALVLMAIVCVVPARGLSRELVYGFVLKEPGPFGPVKVQTYNFGVVKVNVPPNVTTGSLFLGADVCCEADSDGTLYIADLPNDSRDFTDKRSWLAQITTWDPDNYSYWVTSPAGIIQLLVNSEFVNNFPVRVGSKVRVTAIKSAWAERYSAIDIKVVSW